jgi:hypothetical protein
LGPEIKREDRRFNVKASNVSVILQSKKKKKKGGAMKENKRENIIGGCKSFKIITKLSLLFSQ